MVLALEPDLFEALNEGHEPGWRASAVYGARTTIEDVPADWTSGSLSFNGDAKIQGQGSIYLAKDGESLVPKGKTDPLAPFGQEIVLERTVTVGPKVWSIPMGRFRITDIPSAREYFRRYPSQLGVVGWSAELKLSDRFEQIDADDFLKAEGPVAGNSVWDEIRRLSPIPIVQSLTDRAVPAGVTYRSRLDAITELLDSIGGVPHMTRQGALTARVKDAWLTATEPVFEINGVIDMDDSMSNNFYNQVQVKSSIGGNDLVAFRQILDESNPLAVTRPIGGRTYRYSSPLLDTQAKVDEAAATVLARVSTRQSKTTKVTCLPQPHIELGDFGQVTDPASGRVVKGEVTAMRYSFDPTSSMTIELIASDTW